MILVINAGSSSLKFELFQISNLKSICKGTVDAIKLPHSSLIVEYKQQRITHKKLFKNHRQALKEVFKILLDKQIINSLSSIKAIGHRVVHGGEKYTQPTIINFHTTRTITKLCKLAPLHNPANLEGITACKKILRKTPNIAVFDTSFHQTLPPKSFLYGLPYSFYKKDGIRRYGFHGISHQYATEFTRKKYKNCKKIITCHLGNGASIAASVNGKCIDTSMGFTPLEGLVMGTRSGDIDPAIIPYLANNKKLTTSEIDQILNKESGLKGISELSSDMRILYETSETTPKNKSDQAKKQAAIRAMEIFSYRITKYIGAYTAAMNGLDALIFTAGIGEKAWYIRRDVCNQLNYLNLHLDSTKNKKSALTIHSQKSKIKVLVVPAQEALQIAKETKKLLK